MRPLTWTKAKPLLEIAGKSILHRTLENLEEIGCETVVLVVGYKAEQVKEKFRDRFGNVKLIYVEQKEQRGTGDALLAAEKFADGNFLVLYGDDYYSAEDLKQTTAGPCIAAKEHEEPQRLGVVVERNGLLTDIVEKPENPPSKLVNTGLYHLDRRIFSELRMAKLSSRGEIELTDAVKSLARKADIRVIKIRDWMPIGYPWDLLNVNEQLVRAELTRPEIDSAAKVSDRAIIKGAVRIGKGTIVMAGAYLEGPVIIGEGCEIGPNCFVRDCTVLGKGVRVGNGCEVKNSIIGDRTRIPHVSYVGDSIIGSDCNFGAGTITANLRHDGKNVKAMVKDKLIDTLRRKLGVMMGDFTKTGIQTSFYPGVCIGPCSWTAVAAVVKRNVRPFCLLDGEKEIELDAERFDEKTREAIRVIKSEINEG